MLQREVAEQIGVDKTSVFNWEANPASPEIRFVPAVNAVRRVQPAAGGGTFGEQTGPAPARVGISQKELAHRLGADPSTLARWERG